jgi:tetratricopeptide (TPR) repeat protein
VTDFVEDPAPNELGYQAARDLGLSLLDAGETASAVPYLERAVALRPTGFVLGRLGSALRDLGRLNEALPRYEEALTLEGRGTIDTYTRIGVAAVLCDMGELHDLLNAREMIDTVLVVNPREAAAHWVAYSIYDKAARKFGYADSVEAALRHKAAARACDPRTDEERRSHQRLRAVRAQRPRPPRRSSDEDPAPSEPAADSTSAESVALPAPAEPADETTGGLLRRVARWLSARVRR